MQIVKKNSLAKGHNLRNFHLDFEAKADLEGGFECNIFSNEKHVVIITGKGKSSESKNHGGKMQYSHYSCKLGDDGYLTRFLESEDMKRAQELLTGEYNGMFASLIEKVKSYCSDGLTDCCYASGCTLSLASS